MITAPVGVQTADSKDKKHKEAGIGHRTSGLGQPSVCKVLMLRLRKNKKKQICIKQGTNLDKTPRSERGMKAGAFWLNNSRFKLLWSRVKESLLVSFTKQDTDDNNQGRNRKVTTLLMKCGGQDCAAPCVARWLRGSSRDSHSLEMCLADVKPTFVCFFLVGAYFICLLFCFVFPNDWF